MEILYQDEHLVVVNKPSGMLVHRTSIASDIKDGFALQLLRDQIGQKVYPVHRLDRPTSGVLLFALTSESARKIKEQFDLGASSENSIRKEYHCLVRGHVEASGTINDELMKENGKMQSATTHFERLQHLEFPITNERYPTTRYSLVKVYPMTGRMHQIRRHFAKKRNYLIGDTKYGDLKANRGFQNYFNVSRLMLHASKLTFLHPISLNRIECLAELPESFHEVIGN